MPLGENLDIVEESLDHPFLASSGMKTWLETSWKLKEVGGALALSVFDGDA